MGTYTLAQLLFMESSIGGSAMRFHLMDRFLTIFLCFDLALGFWCLSVTFATHGSTTLLVC